MTPLSTPLPVGGKKNHLPKTKGKKVPGSTPLAGLSKLRPSPWGASCCPGSAQLLHHGAPLPGRLRLLSSPYTRGALDGAGELQLAQGFPGRVDVSRPAQLCQQATASGSRHQWAGDASMRFLVENLTGTHGVCTVHVFQGLGEGPIYPADRELAHKQQLTLAASLEELSFNLDRPLL